MKMLLVALAASLFAAAPATAAGLDRSKAQALVDGFYAMLNKPAGKDIAALAGTVLSPDWKSYASDTDFKGRDAFVKQVIGFGKLIPDLTWTVKDVLVDGDRIVVRSTATGSPTGPLFGVDPQRPQLLDHDDRYPHRQGWQAGDRPPCRGLGERTAPTLGQVSRGEFNSTAS